MRHTQTKRKRRIASMWSEAEIKHIESSSRKGGSGMESHTVFETFP